MAGGAEDHFWKEGDKVDFHGIDGGYRQGERERLGKAGKILVFRNGKKEVNTPNELKYTKSHEWVKLEGDIATIGITDHAQSELGDVVFVELPEAGRALKAEETFGSVESVKTVSDVYSPISGEVVESNAGLGAQSELVNSDPYGEGWLIKIKVEDPAEVEGLLTAEGYSASLDD